MHCKVSDFHDFSKVYVPPYWIFSVHIINRPSTLWGLGL